MPLLYLSFFIFLYFYLKGKRRSFDVACYINVVYLVCVICFVILYYFYPKSISHIDRISFSSVLSHLFLLSLFIGPFIIHSQKIAFSSFRISDKGLSIFSWCIIIPSILAMMVSVYDVVDIIAFGNYEQAREAYLNGEIDGGYIRRYGIIGYILSFGPQTCFVSVTMFFYFYFYKRKKKLGLLLFFASFSLVVQNLSIAGREGFVRWAFYFGFNAILFKKYLSYKSNDKFWKLFLLAGIIMIVLFSSITLDRFEESTYGPFYSIISYAGQPFYIYSYNYQAFWDKNTSGFLSILSLFGGNEDYLDSQQALVDFATNTFPTFVGNFISKIGLYRTALFGLLWFVFLNIIFGLKRKFSFTMFITYITLCDVILIGVLYFIHYPRFTQISMVLYIMLAFILNLFHPYKISNNR